MNNEMPNIKIPPCHCRREAVLNIRKRQGETIYSVMCKKCGSGKWADSIVNALAAWSNHNESK